MAIIIFHLKRYHKLRLDHNQLVEDHKKLETDFNDLTTKHEQSESKRSKLESNVTALTQQINEKDASLKKYKSAYDTSTKRNSALISDQKIMQSSMDQSNQTFESFVYQLLGSENITRAELISTIHDFNSATGSSKMLIQHGLTAIVLRKKQRDDIDAFVQHYKEGEQHDAK